MHREAVPRSVDLIVRGGTVVIEQGSFIGDLFVANGKIAAISSANARQAAAVATEEIDVRGRLVLPGFIDPHVHYWEPGPYTYREDFETGSMGSAAGGVTTVLEHPLSVPPVLDAAAFDLKLAAAQEKSVVDFGLWGALLPNNVQHLAELQKRGVVAVKAFMSDAGADYEMVDDAALLDGLAAAAGLDLLVGVHAESEVLTSYYTRLARAAGRREPTAIGQARPEVAEYEAIQRALMLAEVAGARLHIVHMSIASGAELVRAARARGVRATVETCAHYLALDQSSVAKFGSLAKCKPPLRSISEQSKLWEQVMSGHVDMLASDHAPYTLDEKAGDIWEAPWGLTGAQTTFPVILSEGLLSRRLAPSAFVRFTSSRAARAFGLHPQKGTIQVGSDADLVVVDPHGEWSVRALDLAGKQRWTPFDGVRLRGRVEMTLVRGRVVYRDGEIVAARGTGRFVGPSRADEHSFDRAVSS